LSNDALGTQFFYPAAHRMSLETPMGLLHNAPMHPEPENLHGRRMNWTVHPEQWTQLVRGFSCFFWGIPLGLLFASGVLNLRLFPQLKLPAYVIGVLVIYWGLTVMKRVRPLTPVWPRRLNQSLLAVFLLVYLAPFSEWWKQMPHIRFFAVNVATLSACALWLLVLINKLCGEVAKVLYDRVFFIEAQLCAWSVLFFVFVPLTGLLGYCAQSAFRHGTPFYSELLSTLPGVYPWLFALILLPFTLTAALSWKTKERCLEAARLSTKPPGRETP
jgi:hypothetical protein